MFTKNAASLLVLLPAILLAQSRLPATESDPAERLSQPNLGTAARAAETYGKLPLCFQANQGQTDSRVKYFSRGTGYTLFLTGDEAVFSLRGGQASYKAKDKAPVRESLRTNRKIAATKNSILRMKLIGGNRNPKVIGSDQLPGATNYFLGNDPKKWRTSVSEYARVRYEAVYPGVDLVYYGSNRQLEYDFIVAPWSDPRRIQFDLRGAKHISRDNNGDLVLVMTNGEVRWHKPVAYQEENGERRKISAHYIFTGGNRVGFEVAKYDAGKPLYIDPLIYSTFLGGSGGDEGNGIALDGAGNIYIIGQTNSIDFSTMNPEQPHNTGSTDVFVTKLNPSGSALVYSTYLGGSSDDTGASVAVDNSGNAYVTGSTASTDFPVVNALQPSNAGGTDAFVSKLNASGSALLYSTYLGGNSGDGGAGIAVDSAGSIYITGGTDSINFPTLNAFQSTCGSQNCATPNAFVTKINSSGSALLYSTYLGGSSSSGSGLGDVGKGIAIDSSFNAYITGLTSSTNFPTMNPFQPTCGCGAAPESNAFVTKLSPSGSALVYSTYLGGSVGNGLGDFGQGIAVDGSGDAYVTGETDSTNFPTKNPIQAANGGGADLFVTKLNPSGSDLVYSTYLGGNGQDWGWSVAADAAGNAYVTGLTHSPDFPTTNALQPTCGSQDCITSNAFVTEINPSGSALVYSTYFGGSGNGYEGEIGAGIAVDSWGDAYITGSAASPNFPTMNAFQPVIAGAEDAFIARISIPTTNVTLIPSANPAKVNQALMLTATVAGLNGSTPTGTIEFLQNGTYTLGTVTLSGGEATVDRPFPVPGTKSIVAIYSGDENFPGNKSPVLLEGVGGDPTTTTLDIVQSPATLGETVSLVSSVFSTFQSSNGPPDGAVTFIQNGTYNLGSASVRDGQAVLTKAFTVAGKRSITAAYSGNASYAASTSFPVDEVVLSSSTTTAVASSLNPSTVGQSVTFTATVSSQAGGSPTGAITFKNGSNVIGTATLNGGQAQLVKMLDVAIPKSITAVYSGDTNFTGSTSSVLDQVVQTATTTTTLVSSVNPSMVGQSVTFTATVAPQYGGTPTGTVQFLQNGTYSLGTVTLSGETAILSHAFPLAGSKSIVAIYSGDGNFVGSTSSPPLIQIVQ